MSSPNELETKYFRGTTPLTEMKDGYDDNRLDEIPSSDTERTLAFDSEINSLDDMLPHVGDFGRYQWLLLISLVPYTFIYGVLYFGQFFITLTPAEHWCHIEGSENFTVEERIKKYIPDSPDYPFYDTCHRFNHTSSSENATVTNCASWVYNLTTIPYISIAAELDWVCDRSYLVAAAQSIFFAGSITGGLIFGWLADHRGRIPALVICNGIALVATIATASSNDFWNFALCRFIAGLAFDNCINIPLIIVMEYVAVNKRSLVVNGAFGFYFAFATSVLPWAAYFIADWKILCYFLAIPLLSTLITPWILPESARWYLASGMTEKVVEKLKRIAKVNKKTLDPVIYDVFVDNVKKADNTKQSATLLDVFKTPRLAKHTLLVTAFWALTALAFDGHVYSLKLLHGSVFVSFTLASATELPAGILLMLTLDRWGRRVCAFVPTAFAAVCSFSLMFITTGTGSLVLAITTRFLLNMSANVVLQYAAELLPTSVRAQGVAFIHIIGIIAHSLAPYVIELAPVWDKLPMLTLGMLSVVTAILILFLPETMGEDMPQTLQDGEDFGKDQEFWAVPCWGRKSKPQTTIGMSQMTDSIL